MSYTTKVDPTAYVTKKKSRLKIYNGHIVFLSDKDNFELELHNPKQTPVLAKIKLNGEYISASGVVLKPGQRVFLDRFLDVKRKFEFSTYEVENTPENRSAIDLNGRVTIEFYDESQILNYPYVSGTNWYTASNNTTLISPNNSVFYYSNGSPFTSTSNTSTVSLETGRIEKGSSSSQEITNTYGNYNYYTSNVVEYKIQPKYTKLIEVQEIRNYCTECGTKVKTNYKFCPSCGNKI